MLIVIFLFFFEGIIISLFLFPITVPNTNTIFSTMKYFFLEEEGINWPAQLVDK
jgi:hypothetical protein